MLLRRGFTGWNSLPWRKFAGTDELLSFRGVPYDNETVHRDASLPLRVRKPVRRPKRLLALQGDARLVDHVRAGDPAAFEVLYERHVAGILSFCRHMLGSQHEAEDAVQQAFVAAHRDMLRGGREIAFKPWLYTIARNRCLSILRARREQAAELPDISTAGLNDEVARRGDLRELVADLQRLPAEQREALVLSELGDLSHAEIAAVLDSEVANVKGLIFRARSAMIERRDARDADCAEIRAELSTATGGGLRRSRLRYHLDDCPGCTAYLADVRRQRKLLGLALPVVPTVGLHDGVMASVGIGAASAGAVGAAAGGASVAGTAGGASALGAAGGAASVGAPLLGGAAAKVAIIGLLAGTAGVATTEAVRDGGGGESSRDTPAQSGETGAAEAGQPADRPGRGLGAAGKRRGETPGVSDRAGKRRAEAPVRRQRRADQRGNRRAEPGLLRGQGPPNGSAGSRRDQGPNQPGKTGNAGKPPPTGSADKSPPAGPDVQRGATKPATPLRPPTRGTAKPKPVRPSPPPSGPKPAGGSATGMPLR